MTRKNTSSMSKPFLLKPALKDYLWGGSRLREEFGKGDVRSDRTARSSGSFYGRENAGRYAPGDVLAETWECSTHPDGPSIAASGEGKGKTLTEILLAHPEYLGAHPEKNVQDEGQLPFLIKLIDAKKDLSIQVHPTDRYAREHEHGQLGKTEMWYVIDADRDARLVYGFYHDMEKSILRRSLDEGTIGKYLQKVKIHRDDVFFIEAGTVHAIGAGSLIAEIQENSNLTYRLYDYDRLDKDGRKRQLHQEKALDVVTLKGSAQPRQPLRVLRYKRGAASELLCRCRYFQVERYLINTELSRELVSFRTRGNSFQAFLCISGCGVIFMEDGDMLSFFKGDCIFVPADSMGLKFHGKAQLLGVSG